MARKLQRSCPTNATFWPDMVTSTLGSIFAAGIIVLGVMVWRKWKA